MERLATQLGLDMEHEPGAHPGKLWIAMHGREDNWQGGSMSSFYGVESDNRYTQKWYEREKRTTH